MQKSKKDLVVAASTATVSHKPINKKHLNFCRSIAYVNVIPLHWNSIGKTQLLYACCLGEGTVKDFTLDIQGVWRSVLASPAEKVSNRQC